MGEGGLAAQALGVVAGGHEQGAGGVGAHSARSDQVRSGGGDQGPQHGIEPLELRFKPPHPSGQLIDSMLSEHRDKHAARRILRRLIDVAAARPLRVTTDHHPAYRKAIRWIPGRKVLHRTNQYLNNLTEQDHRAIKQCYYPMLGFGSFESAARFCAAFDELRQYFRVRRRGGDHVALGEQRRIFVERWRSLIADMTAA